MTITIPTKGGKVSVEPANPTYEAELLCQGYVNVIRHSVDLVIVHVTVDDGPDLQWELPLELWRWFQKEVPEEPKKAEAPGRVENHKLTPAEARQRIEDYKKDRTRPKPSGHVYAVARLP